jgi:hypothetical protein
MAGQIEGYKRGQGFKGSSEMLKNYKKRIWKKDIEEIERMLKALIKS